MTRIAPTDVYGVDGAGVRRLVRSGDRVPPGLELEEPLPETAEQPPEEKLADESKARRASRARSEKSDEEKPAEA
jgi:hypothetical protein